MPAPYGETAFVHAALDVCGDRRVGPGEHRFIVRENTAQTTDGRHIGDRIGVVTMMAIRRGQRAAEDLMHAHEQFRRAVCAEHFFDEAVNVRIAECIHSFETGFLFAEPLAKQARGVRVIKNVPAGFELHLELGDGERPRAERLHEPALEIEEPQQSSRVLRDGELAAEQARIARKAEGKSPSPFRRGGVLIADVDVGDVGGLRIPVSAG